MLDECAPIRGSYSDSRQRAEADVSGTSWLSHDGEGRYKNARQILSRRQIGAAKVRSAGTGDNVVRMDGAGRLALGSKALPKTH
jgi:hypothetical protein